MQEMSDATTRGAREAEAEFFRTLNALVEPAVRAGCASRSDGHWAAKQ